ncbi:MAG: hypothetical protein M3P85_07340 [Actinomycetota bacterium]|nr:hypothetical protein [Actinomycetota bacterium]
MQLPGYVVTGRPEGGSMGDLLRTRPAGPPAADAAGRSGGIGRASTPAAERVSDDLR